MEGIFIYQGVKEIKVHFLLSLLHTVAAFSSVGDSRHSVQDEGDHKA